MIDEPNLMRSPMRKKWVNVARGVLVALASASALALAAPTAEMPDTDRELLHRLALGDAPPSAKPARIPQVQPSDFDIPVHIDARVRGWLAWFQNEGAPHLLRWHERGKRIRPQIEEVLEAHGVPRDLYFLALIESGFAPAVESSAGAVGIWQFMPETARALGLRVTSTVDERRDPKRSTIAAAAYLHQLHERFQDAHLTLAAYNAGPTAVAEAVSSGGTRDYWTLCARKILGTEACNFVPKIIAAALAVKARPAP